MESILAYEGARTTAPDLHRILAALNTGSAGKLVESTGSGYLPPHHASLYGMSADVRYAAGIDKGMIPVRG